MNAVRIEYLRNIPGAHWAGLLALFLIGQTLLAQNAQVADEQRVIELDPVEVWGELAEESESLNPLSRTVESLTFGDLSLLDTPRAVTLVTPAAMRQLDIDSFEDLDRVGAGTQRINYFGIAGTPFIRGAKAGTFLDGMLRAYQRNNMPVSFGAAEGVEIVKGPAPAHLSPTLVGGYVNLLPKSPYYDTFRGSVNIETGRWGHYRAQVDIGSPIKVGERPAAYRLSLTYQDSDSYYDHLRDDYVSLYGAFRAKVSDTLSLFTAAEFYDYSSSENPGWNRPTQELIDRSAYVLGEPVDVTDPEWNDFANRNLASFPQGYAFYNGIQNFNALVVPTASMETAIAAGRVPVNAADALLDLSDPDDLARAYGQPLPSSGQRDPRYDASANPELDAKLAELMKSSTSTGYRYTEDYFEAGGIALTAPIKGNEVLSAPDDLAESQDAVFIIDLLSSEGWRNQTLIEWQTTDKLSTYGYANSTEQFVADNKITLTSDLDGLRTSLSYGAEARYTYGKALEDFFAEPFSRRDLTDEEISSNSIILAGPQTAEGTGGLNLWSPAIGPNVGSNLWQLGVFAVAKSEVTERFSLLSSLRLEGAYFSTGVPTEVDLADEEYRQQIEGNGTENYFMLALNPVYKLTPNINIYGALQQGTAIAPSDGGTIFGEENFTETELYEVGLKAAAFDRRLYLSLAGYHWDQALFSALNATAIPLRAKGVEVEVAYQDEKLSLIASFDVQRVNLRTDTLGFGAFPFTEEDWALNGGLFNAGRDRPTPLNPDNTYAGFPEVTAKLYASYQLTQDLRLGGGPVWRDSFWHNHDHTLRLPSSIVWYINATYEWQNWAFSASVENAFDEDYYQGSDPVFSANTLLVKAPPRYWQFSATYAF